ncbi:MAG: Fic family protein [Clostridia bacterium]|nr:Fic family protein [Clostridia bacterium]
MNEVKDKINPLILSSIFHYEFVFIHPFHDGNGRTARLWQTAILSHWEKAFTYLPIESMIRKNQEEYYRVIQNCNNAGESTEFIEFMLKIINDTIDELMNSKEMKDKSQLLLSENETKIIECIKRNVLIGAKEIIEETNIADRTVRRILKKLLDNNTIETAGNGENDPNKKYKITE